MRKNWLFSRREVLDNQSKSKTFNDLEISGKPVQRIKPHDLLNEIPPNIIHEIKTKDYNVINVQLFHFTQVRFHFKKGGLKHFLNLLEAS